MGRTTVTTEDSEPRSQVDLTPMLDVVFIMLIFFVVTAVFVREDGIDVSPPNDSAEPNTVEESIVIDIDADSRIWIGLRSVDERAVRANVERLSVERPDSKVVIRANPRSNNRTLVRVMDASRAAGVYDIALAPL